MIHLDYTILFYHLNLMSTPSIEKLYAMRNSLLKEIERLKSKIRYDDDEALMQWLECLEECEKVQKEIYEMKRCLA